MLPQRNLRPDHDSLLIRHPLHALIMRIVCKPHEVGIQVLEEPEDVLHILIAVSPPRPVRSLGVHIRSLQKNRLPIQQNPCPIHANIAEPDNLIDLVLTRSKLDLIKLRRLMRPKLEPARLHLERRLTVAIRLRGGLHPSLGNADRNLRPSRCADDMDIPSQRIRIRRRERSLLLEVNIVVVNKPRGHRHQRHIPV